MSRPISGYSSDASSEHLRQMSRNSPGVKSSSSWNNLSALETGKSPKTGPFTVGYSEKRGESLNSRLNDLKHYYLAVDRPEFKLNTLVDLLQMLSTKSALPVAIVCGSRDTLDSLMEAIEPLSAFAVSYLSDQTEDDRRSVLESFKSTSILADDKSQPSDALQSKGNILISTEAFLPSQSTGEQSLGAHILINFDIPQKKEFYFRRISHSISQSYASIFGKQSFHGLNGNTESDLNEKSACRFVINFLAAGEVPKLRSLEESCNITMAEMPINIAELVT